MRFVFLLTILLTLSLLARADVVPSIRRCDNSNGVAMKHINGYLIAECQPDTLYTWQSPAFLKRMLGRLSQGNWHFNWETTFFARSPLSTFGYGPISIRVKLKSGIQFRPLKVTGASSQTFDACTGLHPWNTEHSVYARTMGLEPGDYYRWNMTAWKDWRWLPAYLQDFEPKIDVRLNYRDSQFADFVICSPEAIHSISWGTEGHYQEMLLDLNERTTHMHEADRYSFDQAYKFFGSGWDHTDTSEAALKTRLETMRKLISARKGKILFNPDLPSEEKTVQQHFSTEKPIYFNPK